MQQGTKDLIPISLPGTLAESSLRNGSMGTLQALGYEMLASEAKVPLSECLYLSPLASSLYLLNWKTKKEKGEGKWKCPPFGWSQELRSVSRSFLQAAGTPPPMLSSSSSWLHISSKLKWDTEPDSDLQQSFVACGWPKQHLKCCTESSQWHTEDTIKHALL